VRGIVIQARLLFFMISRKQLDSSPTPLSSELFFGNLQIGLQCLGGRLHAPTNRMVRDSIRPLISSHLNRFGRGISPRNKSS